MNTIDNGLAAVRAFITHYPLLAIFLSGAWAGISIDLFALARWKGEFKDATFDVRRHLLTYAQGGLGNVLGTSMVTGAVAGAGAVGFLLVKLFF